MSNAPRKSKANTANQVSGGNGASNWKRWIAYFSIALIGATLDLLTKQWVFASQGLPGTRAEPWWLIEPFAGIETAVNPGALFGMGAGWGPLFAALSVVAALGLLGWLRWLRAIESWWLAVTLGLVTGGILGNLYDRLGLWNPPASVPQWQSGVRDWILLRYGDYTWPNFNIADSLLVCGACMLAIHAFWGPSPSEPPDATGTSEESVSDSAAER